MDTLFTSFTLSGDRLKEFKELVPVNKRTKIINEYLLNEYGLPEDVTLMKNYLELNSDYEVQPLHVEKLVISKMATLVAQLNSKLQEQGEMIAANNSVIMRHVLDLLIERYKEHPIEVPKKTFKVFNVIKGTVEDLDKIIPAKQRSQIVEEFVWNEYEGPSGADIDLTPPRGQAESLPLKLTDDCYKHIDKIARKNQVNRSQIIRDIIHEMGKKSKGNSPIKQSLEDILSKTLKQLEDHATPQEIREILEKYGENK